MRLFFLLIPAIGFVLSACQKAAESRPCPSQCACWSDTLWLKSFTATDSQTVYTFQGTADPIILRKTADTVQWKRFEIGDEDETPPSYWATVFQKEEYKWDYYPADYQPPGACNMGFHEILCAKNTRVRKDFVETIDLVSKSDHSLFARWEFTAQGDPLQYTWFSPDLYRRRVYIFFQMSR